MKRIKIKQILQTANKLRTSRGFGVHSPFAFSFILNVLRNPYAYYSYQRQEQRHSFARQKKLSHEDIPDASVQHLVFRIVNRFSPKAILQIGHECGLAVAAALDASSKSMLIDVQPNPMPSSNLYSILSEPFAKRIKIESNINEGIELLKSYSDKSPCFLLINNPGNLSSNELISSINPESLGQTIYLFTNIHSSPETENLWKTVNDSLESFGMTFTNGSVGIIVVSKHLPRQTYNLYL